MKSYLGKIRRFLRVEKGLVAVEWVALTSGLVIGAIIIGVMVMDATADEAETIVGSIDTDATAIIGQASWGTSGQFTAP